MHDSLVTVGNGGNKAVRAQFTILYNQGSEHYQIEQMLAPDEQMFLDFGKLIHDRVPDKDGHTLPPDLTSGAYQIRDLTDIGVGNLYEGKVIVDKSNGHAAYGCGICCGRSMVQFTFDPLPVPVSDFGNQDVTALDQCSNQRVDVTDVFDKLGTWWTDNTAIATASKHQINGIAAGATNHYAKAEMVFGHEKPYGGECPMQTWTPQAPVNVVSVQVTGADIENNDVDITLAGPSGDTGTLTVIVNGGPNNHPQFLADGGAAMGSGNYQIPMNRTSLLSADTYTSVTADWDVGGGVFPNTLNLSRKWIVRGTIRHSQYNTVYESACPTATQTAYLYTGSGGSCSWQTVTLRSQYVSQNELNGTGVSQNYGVLKYDDGRCASSYPPGANSSNSLLKVSSITGQCNTTLIGGDSVATNPGPFYSNPYACGDNLELVNGANQNSYLKHVADQCANSSSGCADGHMDNYSSTQACSGRAVGDLPGSPYWTVDDQ